MSVLYVYKADCDRIIDDVGCKSLMSHRAVQLKMPRCLGRRL